MASLGTSKARFAADEDNVLVPELLMPSQYYTPRSTTPYHRLLLALLEDAIRCFQHNLDAKTKRRQRLFRETEYWLFDTGNVGFMSCPTVCESLGISSVALRRSLRQWRSAIRDGRYASRLGRRAPVFTDHAIAMRTRDGRRAPV
jgi:hypothetical protein